MQLKSCCHWGGAAGSVGVEGEGEGGKNSPSLSVSLVLFKSKQIGSNFLAPLEKFPFFSALILKRFL